jgi:hypothetical protein
VGTTIRSLAVLALFALPIMGCSDDPAPTGSGGFADLRSRDTTRTQSDTGATPHGDASEDVAPDPGSADIGPGPGNEAIGCLTDDECPAEGEDLGVCCTSALRYESFCSTESACSEGDRDACLSDSQCAARRPGSWTVCCHDRGAYHYCAPIDSTCQPLTPCDNVGDCAGEARNYVCCSYHAYYQGNYCINEFLAENPGTDCP